MLYAGSGPQPYEELDHPADLRVRVRGASAAEALGRLVLVHAELLSGAAVLEPTAWIEVALPGAESLALIALELLRECNRRFHVGGELVAALEVLDFSVQGARLRLGTATCDAAQRAEGHDIKAVTYHAARFEADGQGYVAEVLFDV